VKDFPPRVCVDISVSTGEPGACDTGAELDEDGVTADSSALPLLGRIMYSTLKGSAPWAGVEVVEMVS